MKLYRGVNIGLDKIDKGNIIPKSNKIDAVLSAGELAGQSGAGFESGFSDNNSCIYHQYDSAIYESSWVSTTTSFKIAKKFAKFNNCEGYVYVLDSELFEKYNIIMKKLENEFYPDEKEVSIREINGGSIPSEVIVEKVLV
ncbi:hypothetical protein HJP15_19355 [Pseudoalteromonas sp. NEC-BIFX-2020_002]|uniref:hypothetical protein n=1 Tax=Pseudoalteromonas sp. NEC-BIFX-2020_002 TaxID=2732353 RepID=UPI0014769EAA|nr:hypothetical protein [Pseudoalteromonas sp. NEC-BIFX-2020_002]NNG45047.1 hypothetical protein [Pseudoalteromonas sp. NEC-BIFX-2020_002]